MSTPEGGAPGIYRHYKNQELYLSLGLTHNRTKSRDAEAEVVYLALYPCEEGQTLHRRTVTDFNEIVAVPGLGLKSPRFLPVHERVWNQQLAPEYLSVVRTLLCLVSLR